MSKDQEELISNKGTAEVLNIMKDKVLKDEDFQKLKLSFHLTHKDAKLLKSCIETDAEILNEVFITDYSLLVSIHLNTKENSRISAYNYRVFTSVDNKYVYAFSIIDFLTV